MLKFLIVILIVGLLSIGVVTYLYFNYEKPNQEETFKYHNLSIAIFDYNKTKIEGNYYLSLNSKNNIYSTGKTLQFGYSFSSIPINSSFYVSSNVKDYYSKTVSFEDYLIYNPNNFRIDLYPEKVGNCTISKTKFDDLSLNLVIECNGLYKYPLFCTRWSSRIALLNLNKSYFTESKIPNSLINKVDRCYLFNKNISNNITNLDISYIKLLPLSNFDYIETYLITGDIQEYKENKIIYENTSNSLIYPLEEEIFYYE
jgi:hypothetical protein